MSNPATTLILNADQAAFVQGAVSICAASHGVSLRPSVGRCTGCRVLDDLQRVTLLFAREQVRRFLDDIARCRTIAVTFSRPSTHQSIQLKGWDAEETPTQPGDLALVAQHIALFADEIAPIGFSREFVRAVFDAPADQLAAVSFTVSAAFVQTPGPAAGSRIVR